MNKAEHLVFHHKKTQNKTFATINPYLQYVLRSTEQSCRKHKSLWLLEIRWIKIVLYN